MYGIRSDSRENAFGHILHCGLPPSWCFVYFWEIAAGPGSSGRQSIRHCSPPFAAAASLPADKFPCYSFESSLSLSLPTRLYPNPLSLPPRKQPRKQPPLPLTSRHDPACWNRVINLYTHKLGKSCSGARHANNDPHNACVNVCPPSGGRLAANGSCAGVFIWTRWR